MPASFNNLRNWIKVEVKAIKTFVCAGAVIRDVTDQLISCAHNCTAIP